MSCCALSIYHRKHQQLLSDTRDLPLSPWCGDRPALFFTLAMVARLYIMRSCSIIGFSRINIDGLIQKRHNPSALAMKLSFFCIKTSNWWFMSLVHIYECNTFAAITITSQCQYSLVLLMCYICVHFSDWWTHSLPQTISRKGMPCYPHTSILSLHPMWWKSFSWWYCFNRRCNTSSNNMAIGINLTSYNE